MTSFAPTGHDRRKETAGWLVLLGRALLPLVLFAIALFGAGVNAAHAGSFAGKIASDLKAALNSSGISAKWAATTSRGTYVQVVVSSSSVDPSLAALRSAILAAGGSVFYVYQSTPAILAVLPAAAVGTIADRSDVSSVVPNRTAFRTASFLQDIAGASGARTANGTAYSGAGVGIAVLDSGIDTCHAALGGRMYANTGTCQRSGRVGTSVDLTRLSASVSSMSIDWTVAEGPVGRLRAWKPHIQGVTDGSSAR